MGEEFDNITKYHEGKPIFRVPIIIDKNLSNGAYSFDVTVEYQVCTGNLCYPPNEYSDNVSFTPANLEKKSFEKTSAIFDYCFTSAFVLEMVMKCIALGFYNEDSGAYVKNPWNVLDGTIVFLGLLGMGSDRRFTR